MTKNSTKLIVLILIAVACIAELKAQVPDSCLVMICPDDASIGSYNPDSILVDTCMSKLIFGIYYDPLYAYAKRWYKFSLPNNPFKIPIYDGNDTIIEMSWRDIDTNFQKIRDEFHSIETKFGQFYVRKEFTHLDTTVNASMCHKIRFTKYQNIDSVIYYLRAIPTTFEIYYPYNCGMENTNSVDKINNNNSIIIFKNSIIYIKATGIIDCKIKIFNLLAVELPFVFRQNSDNEITIEITDFPAGLYFVQLGNKIYKIYKSRE